VPWGRRSGGDDHKTVNGIIQLIVFSCGPDSIASEIAIRFARKNTNVPLLQLVFDELTGEAGVKTRIEAFIDMVNRRMDENSTSLATVGG